MHKGKQSYENSSHPEVTYFMLNIVPVSHKHLCCANMYIGNRRWLTLSREVKCMQRPGTEAIRTQIQPSNTKREITKIKDCQNTKRTYGQPSQQIFHI